MADEAKNLCPKILHSRSQSNKNRIFLGSSLSQWRQDTQKKLEEAIKNETGRYICMDIRKTFKVFINCNGKEKRAGVLTVSVLVDQIDKAEQGFMDIFKN